MVLVCPDGTGADAVAAGVADDVISVLARRHDVELDKVVSLGKSKVAGGGLSLSMTGYGPCSEKSHQNGTDKVVRLGKGQVCVRGTECRYRRLWVPQRATAAGQTARRVHT